MRSWGRRVALSVALTAAAALPAAVTAAEPDPATPDGIPVKATAGTFTGLYLIGEIFFPPIRLCAYQFGAGKVRVIASRAGGLFADDVVATVAQTQFKPFLINGRHEVRLEVQLPNTLGRELDMQLYAGKGQSPSRLGPGYGYHLYSTWGPTFLAGPDSTAWIGISASRDLSFQWGWGTGACYVSPT